VRLISVVLVAVLFLTTPAQVSAATHSLPLSRLGYGQDILVKGANTQLSLYFPLPKAAIQPASRINLYLAPSPYLHPNSTVAVFLNDQAAASLTAGQLKQNPQVQLALPAGAITAGGVNVSIRTGLFVSEDVCADYRKGYLFYTVRNQSNLALDLIPLKPGNIPDFFAGLYQGATIVLPEAPSKEEIAAGIWLYAALQKSYPYQNMQISIGAPQGSAANLPQIRLALRNRLPQQWQGNKDDIYLAQPDKLVVTAAEGRDLLANARQLLAAPTYAALPIARSVVNAAAQQTGSAGQERLYFGNQSVQEGIGTVAMDFPIYPGQLAAVPQTLGVHLESRYSPSGITGKPVRLNVFFNRNLIHSEVLDNSGGLNRDITLPGNMVLRSRNVLAVEFVYPETDNNCAVRGPRQHAQVLATSYVAGVRSLNRSGLSWERVGMLFGRSGLLLLEDNPSPDLIRAAAQAMVFLNSQLPERQFATAELKWLSEYKEPLAADYIVVLAGQGSLPEELTQGLPLRMGQRTTIYQTEGQTAEFTYQYDSDGVLGQIGQYKGVPLIAFQAVRGTQQVSQALFSLTQSYAAGEPQGNLYVYRDGPAFLSTLSPAQLERPGIMQMISVPWNLYEQVYRLAGEYYRFLFVALLALLAFVVHRIVRLGNRNRK